MVCGGQTPPKQKWKTTHSLQQSPHPFPSIAVEDWSSDFNSLPLMSTVETGQVELFCHFSLKSGQASSLYTGLIQALMQISRYSRKVTNLLYTQASTMQLNRPPVTRYSFRLLLSFVRFHCFTAEFPFQAPLFK